MHSRTIESLSKRFVKDVGVCEGGVEVRNTFTVILFTYSFLNTCNYNYFIWFILKLFEH